MSSLSGRYVMHIQTFCKYLTPFPFAGWKMECDWGRTRGKVMMKMTTGYDIISCFNQLFSCCLWRIKGKQQDYECPRQGISLCEWSLRTRDLHLGDWPLVQPFPPLDHRKVKGITGCSPEEQPHKLVFYFCWNLPSIIPSLLSPFTILWNKKQKTWSGLT